MESFRQTLGSDTFAQNFINNGTLLRMYFTGVPSSPITDIPGPPTDALEQSIYHEHNLIIWCAKTYFGYGDNPAQIAVYLNSLTKVRWGEEREFIPRTERYVENTYQLFCVIEPGQFRGSYQEGFIYEWRDMAYGYKKHLERGLEEGVYEEWRGMKYEAGADR